MRLRAASGMRGISEATLLRLWERGTQATSGQRALALLAAASERPSSDAGMLTPGQRDARLLALRQRLFGDLLDGVAHCPICAVALEFSVPTAVITPAEPTGTAAIQAHGYHLQIRAPTLADLATLTPGDAVESLLRGCVTRAEWNGAVVPAAELPQSVLDVVDTQLAVLDPGGSIELALRCPDCGHEWPEPLDVCDFLWFEIERWARRVLQEVHVLARSYGWTEREVLRLGPQRRRHYLELALA